LLRLIERSSVQEEDNERFTACAIKNDRNWCATVSS
jgi:hypothetical protein